MIVGRRTQACINAVLLAMLVIFAWAFAYRAGVGRTVTQAFTDRVAPQPAKEPVLTVPIESSDAIPAATVQVLTETDTSNVLRAVKDSNTDVLRTIIESGIDPRLVELDGTTLLHEARAAGIARLLLDAGLDVNALDKEGMSPLQRVVINQRSYPPDSDLVQLLIDRGATVNSTLISHADYWYHRMISEAENRTWTAEDAGDVFVAERRLNNAEGWLRVVRILKKRAGAAR